MSERAYELTPVHGSGMASATAPGTIHSRDYPFGAVHGFWAEIVEPESIGLTYSDERYWIRPIFIKPGQITSSRVETEYDPPTQELWMDESGNVQSGPPTRYTASNMAEVQQHTHSLDEDAHERVWVWREPDRGGVMRYVFRRDIVSGAVIQGCNPIDGNPVTGAIDATHPAVFSSPAFTITPLLPDPGFQIDLNVIGDYDYFTNERDQFIRLLDEPADVDHKCGVRIVEWEGMWINSYCFGGGDWRRLRNLEFDAPFKIELIDVSKAQYKISYPIHADDIFLHVQTNVDSGSGCNGIDILWLGFIVDNCAAGEGDPLSIHTQEIIFDKGLTTTLTGANEVTVQINIEGDGVAIVVDDPVTICGPYKIRWVCPLGTAHYLINTRYDAGAKTFYQEKAVKNLCTGVEVSDGEEVVFVATSCPTPTGLSAAEFYSFGG